MLLLKTALKHTVFTLAVRLIRMWSPDFGLRAAHPLCLAATNISTSSPLLGLTAALQQAPLLPAFASEIRLFSKSQHTALGFSAHL